SKNLTKAVEEEVRKCTDCHKADDSPNSIEGTNEDKKFAGKDAINSKDAYHGNGSLVGCIGCHKERGIEPNSCNSCHNGKDKIDYKYKKTASSGSGSAEPIATVSDKKLPLTPVTNVLLTVLDETKKEHSISDSDIARIPHKAVHL